MMGISRDGRAWAESGMGILEKCKPAYEGKPSLPLSNLSKEPFNRSRFMKNWWKAKACHGCKPLHIGRNVDHNHCDKSDSVWARDRVNGRTDVCLGRKYLDMRCHLRE